MHIPFLIVLFSLHDTDGISVYCTLHVCSFLNAAHIRVALKTAANRDGAGTREILTLVDKSMRRFMVTLAENLKMTHDHRY